MASNSNSGMSPTSPAMMDRLMGILTLKAPVYKEVAEDRSATSTAGMIVVGVAILSGIINGLLASGNGGGALVGALITTVITTLVYWVVNSWLLAFVAKSFFQGDTNTGEMLRVTGFASIFQLAQIIPIIGGLIALVLGIIAAIIGIREAANVDNTKAIIIAIIAGVVTFIIIAIIAFIIAIPLALIGLATGAIPIPTPVQ